MIGYLARLALLVWGLFVFAYGITMTLGSGLGLGPWDVLHQGLSLHTPLTLGQSSILVGGLLILTGFLLRERPGVATVFNMVLVGGFVDLILAYGLALDARHEPFLVRLALDLGGIAVVGIGSALYIKAAMGAGPRDALMLALSRMSGRRVALVRAVLETAALAIGFALGGTAGIGTLLFALGVGPAVELSFRATRVPNPAHQRR